MTPARTFPGSQRPGAPGIYAVSDPPLRALTGERMDVCAFAGVAPRGPAREPVIDEKWPDLTLEDLYCEEDLAELRNALLHMA